MRKFLTMAASTAVLLASPALAQNVEDDSGWYLRANAGYGIHQDAEFDSGVFVGDVESEGNVAGSLGIGYEFGDGSDFENFRIELDADSLWTDLGAIGQQPNSFAKLQTNTLMANILYDFNGLNGDGSNVGGVDFVPYIGAGVGLVQGRLDAVAHDALGTFDPVSLGIIDNPACLGPVRGECEVRDSDLTFGWQLLAGLGIDINKNLTWDTHYTFMRADTGGLDFDGQFNRNAGTLVPSPSFIHETELDDIGAHTLVTGLRYKFGESFTPPPPPPPPPAPTYKTCSDTGVRILASEACPTPPPPPPPPPTYVQCQDGSSVLEGTPCPVIETVTYQTCTDGSQVTDLEFCPVIDPVVQAYNNCGASNVAIFNVPVQRTPKTIPRLGTMPEFGDSHGLSPSQFYQKLQSRYSSNATDRAYLNYLFKSMGYTNGFKDANEFMFSEETLQVGTAGLLGLGEAHHYEYSVLPSSDRDRQAFRIQSANGSVVHFMKTCGNYFYACN